jgi:hypothetical protein
LKWFVGREVRISITSFGGPYVLVTGEFRRAKSYILVANRPLDERTAASDVVVFVPRRGPRLLQSWWIPPVAAVRRWFTQGFMNDDFDRLRGMRYDPSRLVAADRELAKFLQWLCDLPQSREALDERQSANAEPVREPLPSPSHSHSTHEETVR